MFRKGRMKITVSKLFRMGSAQPFTESYLVELSVLTASQDGIGNEMVQFAEKLKPLVKLEKIDYKRL